MVFTSIDFLIFFLIFFFFYWFVFNRNLTLQNLFLLLASYVFYDWWDWRFLSLLVGSSLINFILGIYIGETANQKAKKLLLYLGLFSGIGTLVFFKYFNFFISSLTDLLLSLNIKINVQTLDIILPLGISFFTFRTLSYLLDIYKGKIKPTTDWIVFFSYVSFFPSLISGPIDKAKLLVPQLEKKRVFDYGQAVDGMRQILWGAFKKIVIADNCANITNQIFRNYHNLPASSLMIGAFFYTIQLYADFSGYSDMAIGFSRLIGFNVTKNFNFPFFSQNIAEYWRRWHISLTSWLTEYVFTPLSISFRDYGNVGLILAILINFTIIGIWHGANWTFVLFGLLHGCYFIPLVLRGTINKRRKPTEGKLLPSLVEFRNILGTFILVMLTNIVFRSDSVSNAVSYISKIFSVSLFTIPYLPEIVNAGSVALLIILFLIIEWAGKGNEYAIALMGNHWKRPFRWAIYYGLIVAIYYFATKPQPFIYFQF